MFYVPFGILTKDEVLDLPSLYWIYKVSFQTALYCWLCQMLHETSFPIINMYSISGQIGLLSYCDTSYSRDIVN